MAETNMENVFHECSNNFTGTKRDFTSYSKSSDNGKPSSTKKGTRRIKRHQIFHLCYKRKLVCPIGMYAFSPHYNFFYILYLFG
ncbi:hypothetical protein K1719_031900 [Acacia pycnantha]|nr:hypothetical protein K1719_031900 [Acacia pycnantha]